MRTMAASATLPAGALDARQRWFGLDAAVTGANAIGYLVLGSWLSDQLGTGAPTYRIIGGALLAFSIIVGLYAASSGAPRLVGWSIVEANAVWVAGSVVVAAVGLGDFNGLGRTWVACQAVVVAVLTVLQASALRDR
jgi:hypothetical protein